MVKKLLEKRPIKAVTVYVDMKDIDRAAKKVCTSMIVLRVTKTNSHFLLYYRKMYLETQRMTVTMRGTLT